MPPLVESGGEVELVASLSTVSIAQHGPSLVRDGAVVGRAKRPPVVARRQLPTGALLLQPVAEMRGGLDVTLIIAPHIHRLDCQVNPGHRAVGVILRPRRIQRPLRPGWPPPFCAASLPCGPASD